MAAFNGRSVPRPPALALKNGAFSQQLDSKAATHMCWKTQPKQPRAQGAQTTLSEAMKAYFRVGEKG